MYGAAGVAARIAPTEDILALTTGILRLPTERRLPGLLCATQGRVVFGGRYFLSHAYDEIPYDRVSSVSLSGIGVKGVGKGTLRVTGAGLSVDVDVFALDSANQVAIMVM